MNTKDFKKFKAQNKKISMLTCYDYSFAKILDQSKIDCILVGDSLAMVIHGYDSTIHADMNMMCLHTRAVRKGAPSKFIVADMPFLSFRTGKYESVRLAGELMKAGANAVKIEGCDGHIEDVQFLVESGIPVMGHIGLTPQSVHQLGGYKVQGKSSEEADRLILEAKKLEDAGCFAIVLECVPKTLAALISERLSIPCIGIGAGSDVDGQVLVLQDMLGMNLDFKTKFVREFAKLSTISLEAFNQFHDQTQEKSFPTNEESF